MAEKQLKMDHQLTVSLFGGEVRAWHKSEMVDLTALWNLMAVNTGKVFARLDKWLRYEKTQAFLKELSEFLEIPEDQLVQVVSRGRSSYTKAHIYVAISAAMHLSPKAEVIVIDTFVKSRLFDLRDEGGVEFKRLRHIFDERKPNLKNLQVSSSTGKDFSWSNLMRLIKRRCGLPQGYDWNAATAEQHKERIRLEEIAENLIKNMDDFQQIYEIMKFV